MKKIIVIISILLLNAGMISAQNNIIIGVEGKYQQPFGSLSDRFNAGMGGSFYLGTSVSDKWTWLGKIEYSKFDDENYDKLFKRVEAEVDGNTNTYKIPLDKLTLSLEVYGISAQANYELFDMDYFNTQIQVGFGFYYWEFERSEYKDNVFVKDSQGNDVNIANIDVPRLFQKDWSGALNLGIGFNVRLVDPVWFTVNANYNLLIAELWPTLALDLENIAGMQSFNIQGGLRLVL